MSLQQEGGVLDLVKQGIAYAEVGWKMKSSGSTVKKTAMEF